jgi:hypothetical protein
MKQLVGRVLSATAVTLAALAPRLAAAQEACQPDDGLSTCLPADNLWPHAGGDRWLGQAPTTPFEEGSAAFGFVLGYLHRPIGLRVASPDPDGTAIYAVEHVLNANLLLGLGVTERFGLRLAAPFVLFQEGASKADIIGSDDFLPRSAIGDLRFGPSYSILSPQPDEDGIGLALRFEITAPSGNDAAFSSAASAVWAPGASLEVPLGRVRLGADVSGRVREKVVFADYVIGSQIVGDVGVSVDVLDDGWLGLSAEVVAYIGVLRAEEGDDGEPGPLHIPAEWLLTARTAGLLDGRLRITGSGGGFLPTADLTPPTTPAFRALLGVHYVQD